MASIRLRDLTVTLDDGTVVINDADVTIDKGEKVLLVGDSGAGAWPSAHHGCAGSVSLLCFFS